MRMSAVSNPFNYFSDTSVAVPLVLGASTRTFRVLSVGSFVGKNVAKKRIKGEGGPSATPQKSVLIYLNDPLDLAQLHSGSTGTCVRTCVRDMCKGTCKGHV